jgi:hypothetical protein
VLHQTLLRALEWAARGCYDLHALLKQWLTNARTTAELLHSVLDTAEAGCTPTASSTAAAVAAAAQHGGAAALQSVLSTSSSSNCSTFAGADDTEAQRQELQVELQVVEVEVSDDVAAVDPESDGGYGSDEGFVSYEEEFEQDEQSDAPPVTAKPVTAKPVTGKSATAKTAKAATVAPAKAATASAAAVGTTASSNSGKAKSNVVQQQVQVADVPQYLLGGKRVTLFGKTLGRALSLLSVARHGLREQELWSLLAGLRVRSEMFTFVTLLQCNCWARSDSC